jgi:hypothetical protein
VTAARSVLADVVFARVMDAIDFNDLLLFESDLEDSIKAASDQGDAGLDAVALLEAAWTRAGETWRTMRAAENEPLDQGDCALCANPPPGLHFEMDLDNPSGGLRPTDPRARSHRHRS